MTGQEIVKKLFTAYFIDQDIDQLLSMVSEDICWIGANEHAVAHTKEDFRNLLEMQKKENLPTLPFSVAQIGVSEVNSHCRDVYGFLSFCDKENKACLSSPMRFTVTCKETETGFLVCMVHLSMASYEMDEPTSVVLETAEGLQEEIQKKSLDFMSKTFPGGVVGCYVEPGFPLYYMNFRALEYLGYTQNTFMEHTQGLLINSIYPDDRSYVRQVIEESLAAGKEYEIRYRTLCKDGSHPWVLVRGKKMIRKDGRPILLSVLFDIDHTMQLHREILAQNRSGQGASQSSVVGGVAKLAGNRNYDVLFASDHFYEMLGYSKEEFREKHKNQAIRVIYWEDFKAYSDILHSVRDRDTPFSMELRVVQKAGTPLWIRLDGSLTDETYQGYPVYYCVYTNIDEQKKKEMWVKRQQYFAAMIATSMAGVTMIVCPDKERTVMYFSENFCRFLGYEETMFHRVCNGVASGFIYEEDLGRVHREIHRSLMFSPYYEVEYRVLKGDGSLLWILEKGNQSIDEEGRHVLVCLLLDNTERRQLQMDLMMEKECYQMVSSLSDQIMWDYDIVNQGKPSLELARVHPDDLPLVKNYFALCRNGKGNLTMEFRRREEDGEYHWFRMEGAILRDEDGQVLKAVGKLTDIQEEKEKNLQLQIANSRDSMTGLWNISYMHQMVDQLLEDQQPEGNATSFFIMDIDNFGQINNQMGHLFGDAVLMNVSRIIEDSVPDNTLLARVGGDGFAILLMNADEQRQQQLAETLQRKIQEVYVGELEGTKISFSIGVAEYPACGTNFFELFQCADLALYYAKKSGKNQTVFFKSREEIGQSLRSEEEARKLFSHLKQTGYLGSGLFNTYHIDEAEETESSIKYNRFLSWSTAILTGTRDWKSAVQLILDRVCKLYNMDVLYIMEPSIETGSFQVTCLREKNLTPAPERDHPILREPGWKKVCRLFDKVGYAVNVDFQRVSDELSEQDQQLLRDKSILQVAMKNGEEYVGYLTAMRNQRHEAWTDSDIYLLQKLCASFTPYLLKKQYEEKADYILNFDTLTHLPLLPYFKRKVQQILDENPCQTYAVTYCDIYNFKFINDAYGFSIGDDILCKIAQGIRPSEKNEHICAARVSDDNFILAAPFKNSTLFLENVDHYQNCLSDKIKEKYPGIDLFFNSGIAEIQREDNGIMKAIDNANMARKTVENQAKNVTCLFDDSIQQRLAIESEMANSMNYALEHDEFVVYLQPKINLADGSLAGAEALVRWKRHIGMIYPDDFIPFFERNGFIINLDWHVFIQVLETLRRWKKQIGPIHFPISINMSRLHGENPKKVQEILEMTRRYGISPSSIEFELTETAFYQNEERLKQMMSKLMKYGYHISIDDFGSGYSSLNTLTSMPANVVKIDKAFLNEGNNQKNKKTVLKYMIALSKELGMQTICEGVETEEQAEFLKEIGCEMAQGYYYSRPISVAQFEQKYLLKDSPPTKAAN